MRKEHEVPAGTYDLKRNRVYLNKATMKTKYFEMLMTIAIVFGAIFHLHYLTQILQVNLDLMFEILYHAMNVILVILLGISINGDVKKKKVSYVSISLIIGLVLLNNHLVIRAFSPSIYLTMLYYALVIVGLFILATGLTDGVNLSFKKMKKRGQETQVSTIFKISNSAVAIVLVILFIVITFLVIFLGGEGMIAGQSAWDQIGSIWNWGATIRNLIIIGVAFLIVAIVEIKMDILFDFDDDISRRIQDEIPILR